MGLAIAAAVKGHRAVSVVPDKMSTEKFSLLDAYGAKGVVVPTVAAGGPRSYCSVAEWLTREIPGAFQPNQFANPANPAAHSAAIGPEIWEQTCGRIDALVDGICTGGTISGTASYLKARNPAITIRDPSAATRTVAEIMESPLPVLDVATELGDVYLQLSGGAEGVLISEKGAVCGIVTKADIVDVLAERARASHGVVGARVRDGSPE